MLVKEAGVEVVGVGEGALLVAVEEFVGEEDVKGFGGDFLGVWGVGGDYGLEGAILKAGRIGNQQLLALVGIERLEN